MDVFKKYISLQRKSEIKVNKCKKERKKKQKTHVKLVENRDKQKQLYI